MWRLFLPLRLYRRNRECSTGLGSPLSLTPHLGVRVFIILIVSSFNSPEKLFFVIDWTHILLLNNKNEFFRGHHKITNVIKTHKTKHLPTPCFQFPDPIFIKLYINEENISHKCFYSLTLPVTFKLAASWNSRIACEIELNCWSCGLM